MFSQAAGGWIHDSWQAGCEAGVLVLATGGAGGPDSKFVGMLMGLLLGAFLGAVVGLVVGRLCRFTAYMAGRHYEGNALILIGALIGAGGFVWMAVTRVPH